ncbi:RluA family pseudouridine synthase [Indiicoccus explosivorum]|uniref:RluA family pseudouridine synthase n=1 Tax=Indiicoccus explosivorum TaxID=1917864 RepID=UPI000B4409C3|nr:RluA family pseudouridine synthase [Indiicoccus explosivorum]
MEPFRLTFTAKRNQLLREALAEWGLSKRTLTAVKYDGGQLLVNGEEKTVRHLLDIGDAVTVVFPVEKRSGGLLAEQGPLQIIFEDEAVLVVSKPAGQSTIPSRDHPDGTLANFVAGYLERSGTPATVHVVTRLDRDTTGLVCIAKNRHIHHVLSGQQKSGTMRRQYTALVHGLPEEGKWRIDAPIGRKPGSIIERQVRPDGQQALTEAEVAGRFCGFTAVRLRLGTGRTHQIRVHLAHCGHPLLGDDLYGGEAHLIGRQALHCDRLEFSHPISGELLSFTVPLPDDMSRLIQG